LCVSHEEWKELRYGGEAAAAVVVSGKEGARGWLEADCWVLATYAPDEESSEIARQPDRITAPAAYPVGNPLSATGEINDDIPALIHGQYGACLITYEKCAALALAQPHILHDVGTVVIDGVQMIVDPTRRASLEFLLTLIRARRRLGSDPMVCEA
jgi:hypothetical protein